MKLPYDEYADSVVAGITTVKRQPLMVLDGKLVPQVELVYNLKLEDFRQIVTEAWLSGLEHAKQLLEEKCQND